MLKILKISQLDAYQIWSSHLVFRGVLMERLFKIAFPKGVNDELYILWVNSQKTPTKEIEGKNGKYNS